MPGTCAKFTAKVSIGIWAKVSPRWQGDIPLVNTKRSLCNNMSPIPTALQKFMLSSAKSPFEINMSGGPIQVHT